MVKEAEEHASEDKKRRELIEARNQADSAIHDAEKTVAEAGDKAGADDKSAIEAAVAALKEVKDGEDVAAIQAKTAELAEAAMKLGAAMYQAAQAEGAEAAPEGQDEAQPEAADDVVDADFEEVDDDQKGKSA